jgi:hypothetical protein
MFPLRRAHDVTVHSGRKAINAEAVLKALEIMGFNDIVIEGELKAQLEGKSFILGTSHRILH